MKSLAKQPKETFLQMILFYAELRKHVYMYMTTIFLLRPLWIVF